MSDLEPIAAFWRFWGENRTEIERAIGDPDLGGWGDRISDVVGAIDPGLDWEFGPGRRATHYFCISAKGDPLLRVVAERWRSAAPTDDESFEFHAARPGGDDATSLVLDFGVARFVLADLRALTEIDDDRERVHVHVWHPSFIDSPEDLPTTVAYIALDSVLGEDDVERWIGAVEILERAPDGGLDLGALRDVVTGLASRATGERYGILRGSLEDGRPMVATANLAIKRVDHLLMDQHVEVRLAMSAPTSDGMLTEIEADRLNGAEDVLLARLGHDAVYIGHETGGGFRTIHFHAAETGPALARIDAWARDLEWPCEVRAARDPAWSILKRW